MTEGRPYSSAEDLTATADRVFDGLGRSDWLEAFDAHARIGKPKDERGAAEQAGAAAASADERTELEEGNAAYEAKFGHVFLICARGLTADELLAALRERSGNDTEAEFANACNEQRKITRLRLEELVAA